MSKLLMCVQRYLTGIRFLIVIQSVLFIEYFEKNNNK